MRHLFAQKSMENNGSIVAIVAAIHGKVVITFLSLLFHSLNSNRMERIGILFSPEPYFFNHLSFTSNW